MSALPLQLGTTFGLDDQGETPGRARTAVAGAAVAAPAGKAAAAEAVVPAAVGTEAAAAASEAAEPAVPCTAAGWLRAVAKGIETAVKGQGKGVERAVEGSVKGSGHLQAVAPAALSAAR